MAAHSTFSPNIGWARGCLLKNANINRQCWTELLQGPTWEYCAKLPAWADEDWEEPDEYHKYLN